MYPQRIQPIFTNTPIYLILFLLLIACHQAPTQFPKPTETTIKTNMEEAENKNKKQQWFEDLHRTAPGVNWRTIEYTTSFERHQLRSQNQFTRNQETYANGLLIGAWNERGSSNQAGSILATSYDSELNALFVISAGGNLFRGDLAGNWTIVNQDLRFSGLFLLILEHGTSKRMFAMVNKIIHFSDDLGLTWQRSSGLETIDNWGTRYKLIPIINNGKTFLYQRVHYWNGEMAVAIFKSENMGETFYKLPDLATTNEQKSRLVKPHNTESLYLLEKQVGSLKLFAIDPTTDKLNLQGSSDLELAEILDLDAVKEVEDIYWYTYDAENILYESQDFANSWVEYGSLPVEPWRDGLHISPSDPNQMMFGEVEAYRSINRGKDWSKINEWGDYYADIEHMLHADIMAIDEYVNPSGDPFTLIANHGGISHSSDFGQTNTNIALFGLNVSQYYSVRTDPNNTSVIYAGSQDQGFQRNIGNSTLGILEFDQIISGDYGHIVFTANKHMWAVYPDGWVIYFEEPEEEGINHSFQLEYANKGAWLPPLVPSPVQGEDVVYILGGSMTNEIASQIIKLEILNNSIKYTELPFDFYDYTQEGYVTALAMSPFNSDIWFSATSNGFLFTSNDAGMNWEQSIVNVPAPHYLYGSKILPSNLDDGHLYVAGSGYSGPAMLFSDDNGQNFEAVGKGLPPTIILDLAFNEDETLIFAATEAGPYVFNVATKTWADMSGLDAPTTTYWSVEYLEELGIIRFGTYGRGIFDFHLSGITSIQKTKLSQLHIFPNPAKSVFTIDLPNNQLNFPLTLSIYKIDGSLVSYHGLNSNRQQFQTDDLGQGTYFLKVHDQNNQLVGSQLFIKD